MKKNQIILLFASLALLFVTSSCLDEIFIDGNGIPKTEFRNAEGFDEVVSSGDFHVNVIAGNTYSVEVTAESNLLPYIETDVNGSTLKIRTRGVHSLRQNDPIEIYITTPVLNGLSISGSGYIKTDSFLSDEFKIAVSGSGDIDTKVNADVIKVNVSGSGIVSLEGSATATDFVISGSGKIKSYKLEQLDCNVKISGSGDVYANASRTIDANISGSGRVYYISNPVIHTSLSGSGSVVDKN